MTYKFTGRRQCDQCGLYFASGEGLGRTCLPCYARQPEDCDPWAYKQPVPPKLSEREVSLSQQLTRAEQGLYFLYVALDKAKGPALPPRHMLESALSLFHRQFPEFRSTPMT